MLRTLLAVSILPAWLLSCPLLQSTVATELQSEELCLIPVKDGQPTSADIGESWRMVAKFVAFDGIAKPVIYPFNRRGAWTIDDTNGFVPFGGRFPQNMFHDQFGRNPEDGTVIGINPDVGVFVIRPGEAVFTLLYDANDKPLRSPHAIIYVPRLKGFALSDSSGLYLLDQQLRLEVLPLRPIGSPGSVFDLPELDALVLNPGEKVYLRDDSGNTTLLATLEKWDFVVNSGLTQTGDIHIKSYRNEFTVPLPRKEASGEFSQVEDAHLVRQRPAPPAIPEMVTGPKIWGRTFFWTSSGLWQQRDGPRVPIALPFDTAKYPITGVEEFPRQQNLIVYSLAGIYALDDQGIWKVMPRSKELVNRVTETRGRMPDEQGVLISGEHGLYLLSSASDVTTDACLK